MCGRFAITTDPALLAEKIKAIDEASSAGSAAAAPNYNVAPTDTIAAVVSRHSEPHDEPTRRVRLMRWGLVPSWTRARPDGAPDTKGPLLINARADKVATSPAFRTLAQGKRCLVPMDGWYEWRANPQSAEGVAGKKAAKTPFFIHRNDGGLVCMAGLWSVWRPNGSAAPLLSCTIITTDAVGELAKIHDRMPLMLAEEDWDAWLNPDAPLDPELLARPPDLRDIELRQVSTLVNSVRNNGPELLAPAKPQPEQTTLL
ncbi:SOS response-associated peptidase [Mycobacterium shinjukuense]|uniref:Abasic site processing protein n=1 Tax=Mycobacterium shinjukuense TaxID=398694 RepID=A0A7I7MQQ2_9MYCO|nr:SOS response-associated peptidase [Mycobacterium shinjukuense]MCV6985354.1 SOS response-associated peptidase [Mycobacterium shinjukuense]ORB69830.1 hypothetical protein BST45_08070 [Mycobacterium shinjukuense]BBX74551.1 DUF159 family protein [Mycobacterium shinjukuense]